MKVSTAWRVCPFTEICGSWYWFSGAGWNITSVFLVLMVSPKLLQAAEKLSISTCILCSSLALRAQSSAKRKSLRTVSFTFVTACSLLGLNNFPSVLNLMLMPGLQPQKASVSIAENIMLNSIGARTQPCLTPLVTEKAMEGSPSSRTRAIIPSWNWRTISMNVLGQPNFFRDFPEALPTD